MKRIAIEEAFSLAAVGTQIQNLAHSSILPEASLRDWADRLGDLSEARLADMDAHGIDVQVLSLTAPGIQALTDAKQAVQEARRANDLLATAIGERPERLAGLAALPLQDPVAAATELDRAVNELGLKGALVNDHTQGRYLDHEDFSPVWEALQGLDVPLYLHPGAPPRENWQVLEGYPELRGPSWSWAAETSAHALRIVYGRVFERFPEATLILGHMGEFLPFQLARFDARYAYYDMPRKLREPPSAYIQRNIAVTTSGVCSHAALVGAMLAIGADRILFAVDYPFERTDAAVEFLDSAPIADTDRQKIAHGNAERLLKL